MRSVRVGGTIVAGATSGSEPRADLKRVFFHQIRIVGARMGSLDEMKQLLALCESEKLVPTIDSVYPLSQTRDALARLRDGGVDGKVVVVP
jgi:D-arabinose 1-dehydrogenase-like Zn-dependent alcohol dehydrogenase